MFTLRLDRVPRHYDDADSDRLLHAMTLLHLEGDLRRAQDGALVGASRPLSGLPLPQERSPADARIELAVDLGADVLAALASGPTAFTLSLRGAAEVWSNPLYDHDGYQKMRVGDRGLAEALQAMGCREVEPLLSLDEPVELPQALWGQERR